MQKLHTAHPVELALVMALAVVEALTVLVVALVALLLTLARWSPAAPPEPSPAPPAAHPLALMAEALVADLACCTVAELRRRARAAGLPRALSRSGRRADLIAALAGMEVAMA